MGLVSIDKLAERVESRFTLVVLAARRAKQIKEGAPRLIETNSTNPLTVALEEIAAGKVMCTVPDNDDIIVATTESELEALPAVEAAQEEALEITAEAPVDEAARVAELLRLPGEDEIEEVEAVVEVEETPAEEPASESTEE